jgi:D-psicose/D-tagatose/L-ribulose 3-epimerase
MKYGMHLFTFVSRIDDSALEVLPRLKRMGYHGCEIPLVAGLLDLINPQKIREALQGLEMECVAGTGIPEEMSTISDDPETRMRGIEHVKSCVDVAAMMGAPLVAGALYAPFGIRHKGRRTEQQWERSVRSLRKMARYAAPKGVTIGLEPLNRYEHFFINTVEDALSLLQDVNEPNVKLHLDTYHMNIEEKDLHRSITRAGTAVCHVHCSENDRGIPGTGHIDWDGVFRGLLDIQYQGWLVIESFFEPIPEISDFTPIWRRLAPDADTLAREGLEFIRRRISVLEHEKSRGK